jgi:uncharacterized protein YdgA (DUF945 family)
MSKTFTLRATAAAALLFATHALAEPAPAPATPAPAIAAAPAPVPKDTVLDEALQALTSELNRAFPWRGNMVKSLDDFASFRVTPRTSEKLVKLFGTDQPVVVKRTATTSTQLTYDMSLQALEYTMADGGVLSWAPFTGTIRTDPAGKRYTADATWPFMKVADKDMTLLLSGMSGTARMRRGVESIWFGAMDFSLKSLSVTGPASFAMDDTSGAFTMSERGKLVDIRYALGTKSIRVSGEDAGSYDLAGRILGLPASAMAALMDAQVRLDSIEDPKLKMQETLKEFKRLAPRFAAAGGAMHIDRLAMTYKGQTATLKGELTFIPMKNVSAASRMEIVKHLNGKFTLRIPVAMMTEIARSIASADLAKNKPGEPVDEAALAEAANNVRDALIGKAVGSGFAALEKDHLVSTIVLRNGKLTANGKPIDLPAPKKQDKAPAQAAAHPPREMTVAAK